MGFWHHLFRRRRRSRVLAASSVPAVATSTVAAPAAPGQMGPALLAQRQYLEDVPYLLPKDSLENERLNFQHYALCRTLGNHYLAPLAPESTRTILDVGTGTGIWAFEMQALFPHAIVVGVDVSLQSLPQPVPPTCVFVHAHLAESLPLPTEPLSSSSPSFPCESAEHLPSREIS